MRYDLKLASGKTVEWSGSDPENAIERYLDGHRDQAVTAWRVAMSERYGIFQWGRGSRIEQ